MTQWIWIWPCFSSPFKIKLGKCIFLIKILSFQLAFLTLFSRLTENDFRWYLPLRSFTRGKIYRTGGFLTRGKRLWNPFFDWIKFYIFFEWSDLIFKVNFSKIIFRFLQNFFNEINLKTYLYRCIFARGIQIWPWIFPTFKIKLVKCIFLIKNLSFQHAFLTLFFRLTENYFCWYLPLRSFTRNKIYRTRGFLTREKRLWSPFFDPIKFYIFSEWSDLIFKVNFSKIIFSSYIFFLAK